MRHRSTRNDTFAARNLALWITLAVGALIGAAITARRIFRSTNDGPSNTPDQADPLQTELEGAAAAR